MWSEGFEDRLVSQALRFSLRWGLGSLGFRALCARSYTSRVQADANIRCCGGTGVAMACVTGRACLTRFRV